MKFRYLLSTMIFIGGWSQAKPLYDTAPITQDMQQIVSLYGLTGASLQVLKNGGPVYNKNFGVYDSNTRVPIASASKWLSALTLARLVEKGQMSWEDTIGQYIPNTPASKKNIRLRQLFSHTSGMSPAENSCMSNPTYTLASCVTQILTMPQIYSPGSTFSYGGNSMQVAGRMAEIATGKSWDQIFIDEMVNPLALTGTDYARDSTEPGYVFDANPRVPGGARSTVRDITIMLAMIQQDGLHQGTQFLSKATLDYMAFNHAAGLPIGYTPYPESAGYGLGLWIDSVDRSGVALRISSAGAYGTTPWVDKRNGVAGVFMVKDEWSRLRGEIFDLQDLVSVVFSTQHKIPPNQKPKPASISPPKKMPLPVIKTSGR